MTEELEKPAEEPMEISKEDAETFKLVIEDLKKNMEEFRKKTEAMQASPPSAKGSFRNKQTAIGKHIDDLLVFFLFDITQFSHFSDNCHLG